MEPTAWVVVIFLNGASYIGAEEYRSIDACDFKGTRDTINTLMRYNCVPTKWAKMPPEEKNGR